MQEFELFNQEAEEAVVGSLFLEEGLVKDCTIRPEQLYLKKLQRLFAAIKCLNEKGKPIDVISVVEEIVTQNLESIGGISYITKLAGSVPTTANFRFYQDTVKEYYQKRKAVEIAGRIRNDARFADIATTLREGIHDLMLIEDHLGDDDLGEIMSSLVDLYSDCGKDLGEITGIPSGFKKVDRLTGGFQESDLIVVGARPSVGKTAFALNIALNASKNDIALIFSLEMLKKQLLKRAASCNGRISSMKMRNPKRLFNEMDWEQFSDAMGNISKANLHIFDKAGMDMNYIWSKVRKVRREYGEQKRILVVIDYLQLIVGDPKHKSNRQAEISEISRGLKQMARELNVAVIALSQLSRGVESRQDKRPMLSDLRESGQIEQDADVIAFLYRDDYYHKQSEQKNIIEIILAKQRNGPIGTIELAFVKEYGRFADLSSGS
ncbi:replicative DNA helicase [Bacillus sp. FJAT-29790]|uniref:replicative DNA helicase n=1 Tax=Bacillus sp. FJAT-29790 TaxID=1895002 RepID=UPI001C218CA5|nr:replicative DNA helicase [Bacillus sp. FJAT-29790]MBU8878795.1 replicative DNA helicase [Bacillus sp. FJAT-29790]